MYATTYAHIGFFHKIVTGGAQSPSRKLSGEATAAATTTATATATPEKPQEGENDSPTAAAEEAAATPATTAAATPASPPTIAVTADAVSVATTAEDEVEVFEVQPPHTRTPIPGEFPYTGSLPKATFEGQIGSYMEIDARTFNVRGKRYLTDKKKVPSAPSLCKLVAADVLQTARKLSNASALPGSPPKLTPGRQFIVFNWQVPCTPVLSFVMNFALPESDVPETAAALALLRRFMSREESDEYRNQRFKLIPGIVEGPWIVKRAVGNTPAIIGNKLTTTYHWGPNYFEVDVDVGSSVAANAIWSLVRNYVRALVIDLAVLIEAKTEDELPEHIIGGLRVSHVGFGPEITKIVPDSDLDLI
jgi:hypothetical protein